MVPLGTNTAAGLPSRGAISSSRRRTVGSSPQTSSPTSACAMAARIPSSGTVSVSLRRSTMPGADIALTLHDLRILNHRRRRSRRRWVVRGTGHARAIASHPFGPVERVVGEAEQLGSVVRVLGERGHPYADGQTQRDATGKVDVG